MRKVRIFIILALVFSFVFAFNGCSVNEEETTNLFERVIKIEEGIISPQKVEFLASPEEVMEANKDLEVSEKQNPEGYAFKGKAIEGISDDVVIAYNFEDDMLTTVNYIVRLDETMDKAGYEEVCNTLYNMALEYMPMTSTTLVLDGDKLKPKPEFDAATEFEPIKEGNGLSWQDEEGNAVRLLFFTRDKYQTSYGFNLSVHVSRDTMYEAVYG